MYIIWLLSAARKVAGHSSREQMFLFCMDFTQLLVKIFALPRLDTHKNDIGVLDIIANRETPDGETRPWTPRFLPLKLPHIFLQKHHYIACFKNMDSAAMYVVVDAPARHSHDFRGLFNRNIARYAWETVLIFIHTNSLP